MTNAKGDRCVHCLHPYIRCFLTFDILPLVEFVPSRSIGVEDAIDLLNTLTSTAQQTSDDNQGDREFNEVLNATLEQQQGSTTYIPLIAEERLLRQIDDGATYITKGLKYQFFRNILNEISVMLSPHYGKFFHSAEYELAVLRDGRCPLSRLQVDLNDTTRRGEHTRI